MPPDEIDNISFHLGGIHTALEHITKAMSDDRSASATYRTEIRKEVKDVREKVDAIGGKLASVVDDVAELKPVVKSLEERAAMSKGAVLFASVLGRAGHLLIAGLGGVAAIVLEHLWRTR